MAGGGIAGRGLLLDIPRVRGVSWLEPGDHVTAGDLIAAEAAQEVRIEQGDLLFVRVGHRSRRRALGAWDVANARAGLHPTAPQFLAERRIAVLGSDGNNDTAPSAAEGVDFPVHVLALPVRPDGRSQHLFNPAGTSCATVPQPFRAASRLLRRPQPAHDDDLVLPRTPTAAGSPS